MARYKLIDTNPRLLPVNQAAQLLPGAFEHAVDHLEEHVTFIELGGARTTHLTTITAFVRTLGADIAHVFAVVLTVSDQQGLIGREMFAI